MFGGSVGAAATSGMFGATAAPAAAMGAFGATPAGGGGMFGSTAPAAASGAFGSTRSSTFGVTAATPAATSSMFGAAPAAGNFFGGINLDKSSVSRPKTEFGSFKTEAAYRGFRAIFLGCDDTVKPGVRLTFDGF